MVEIAKEKEKGEHCGYIKQDCKDYWFAINKTEFKINTGCGKS